MNEAEADELHMAMAEESAPDSRVPRPGLVLMFALENPVSKTGFFLLGAPRFEELFVVFGGFSFVLASS